MQRNYSHDLGIMTVSEMIDFLKSIQGTYGDWPIYCCGSDECYLCINEEEQYIVLDMEDLFKEFDDDGWLDDFMQLKSKGAGNCPLVANSNFFLKQTFDYATEYLLTMNGDGRYIAADLLA